VSLTPGTRLGPYEIVSALGAGGMGEVYRARDPRLGRDVAIKVLPATISADPARLRRFEQEARAAAALNHPNIVTIHSVEQAGDVPFVTMELVEGLPLSKLIPRAGMPLGRTLPIAMALGDAISAAHSRSCCTLSRPTSAPPRSPRSRSAIPGSSSARCRTCRRSRCRASRSIIAATSSRSA
jgi:serine/threonine protein kinase